MKEKILGVRLNGPEFRFYVIRLYDVSGAEVVGATVDAREAARLLAAGPPTPGSDGGLIACRYGESFRILWSTEVDGPPHDPGEVEVVCERRMTKLFGKWA